MLSYTPRMAKLGIAKPHIRFRFGVWWAFTRRFRGGGFNIGKGGTPVEAAEQLRCSPKLTRCKS